LSAASVLGRSRRYGLVHPITSNNPLKVEFAAWVDLARDLWRARSLRAFVGAIVMPPGWSDGGSGETTEEMRAKHVAKDFA
jgi:hypothetical protein